MYKPYIIQVKMSHIHPTLKEYVKLEITLYRGELTEQVYYSQKTVTCLVRFLASRTASETTKLVREYVKDKANTL